MMGKFSIRRSIHVQVNIFPWLNSKKIGICSDGDIYVCGFSEDYSQDLPDSGNSVSIDENGCNRLQQIAVQVASTLENSNVETRQACYLPQSNDGIPLIGRLHGLNNVYVAAVNEFISRKIPRFDRIIVI